ncbi:MAG TPA: hypothetical protein VIT44_13025 [Cyclobacteriaceae bacterium]
MKAILILLTLFTSALFAQTKKIKSFKVEDAVTFATVDRAGDFYIVLKTGEIQKFDKDGIKLASYKGKPNLTSFDPTNAIRLLTYYMDNHEYTWLSPSLSNPNPNFEKLDPSWAVDPSLICIAGDYNLWILDKADWNLKKINPRLSTTLAEFSITKEIPNPQITIMKEYLNFIFLINAEKEILAYNAIGKMIKKIEVQNLNHFNFLGEELYYQQGSTIHFFDLYTAEKRTMVLTSLYDKVLLTDERMFTISGGNAIDVFEFKP